jgi:hypothetical protein
MTVAELINQLQAMPSDATVAVIDADTGWHLLVLDVVNYSDLVLLTCEYGKEAPDEP